MEFQFMNKMEKAIFKHFNPDHDPYPAMSLVNIAKGSVAVVIFVFVVQMFAGANFKTAENVLAVLGVSALIGWVFKTAWPTIQAFPTWVGKTLYSIYLVAITFGVFYLTMWGLILVIAGCILWFILKIMAGPDKKPQAKITYSDGTEEIKDVETGMCGERTVTDRDGDIHEL